MGSLSEEAAAGGPEQEPAPDYIAATPPPSDEVWAREQALYRAKDEEERQA